MPIIEEIFDSLTGTRIFPQLDCESGIHQIDMDPSGIQKTAFRCKKGILEYLKILFGLKNAPATIQRAMDSVITGYL